NPSSTLAPCSRETGPGNLTVNGPSRPANVMRVLARFLFILIIVALSASSAPADCSFPYSCVTGFSISPGSIKGDNSQAALATVQVNHAAYGSVVLGWNNGVSGASLISHCGSGGTQSGGYCVYPNQGPGNVTVTLEFMAISGSSSTVSGTVTAFVEYNMDPGMQASLSVSPVPTPWQSPNQEPDPRCCSDGGYGGKPINFLNGNTWITQRDYSIPGLGGGISLERTWNSLWQRMQPFEQSGIFGDSWRSTFEEHIQTQTGGNVKYWKGDGGALFYAYSGVGGSYYMTAPADDQTTLNF